MKQVEASSLKNLYLLVIKTYKIFKKNWLVQSKAFLLWQKNTILIENVLQELILANMDMIKI